MSTNGRQQFPLLLAALYHDQSKANPCGTILSCALLLRYSLGLEIEALALEAAVAAAIADGGRTADLGGNLKTQAFTDKVLYHLPAPVTR